MAEGVTPERALGFGEPLAPINAASNRNRSFALPSLGGRWVLICAVADPQRAPARAALTAMLDLPPGGESARVAAAFLADLKANDDVVNALGAKRLVFVDPQAAATCRLIDANTGPDGRWILFDPSLRALSFWPLSQFSDALAALENAPDADLHAGAPLTAPVLMAPRVFEPEFCRKLIDYYKTRGGAASGVTVTNEQGKAAIKLDDAFKRRSDCPIDDAKIREAAIHRIYWRLAPEIEKAFMWRPTRLERYIVARYGADEGGYFRPHRDNTTPATAHRRFAVTINLNVEDYEGGDLRFPEFGSRTYRAPTGGAVVFSCATLHEATPVTRGERFAFLPFLYDEEAAKIRAANNHLLDESIRPYGGE